MAIILPYVYSQLMMTGESVFLTSPVTRIKARSLGATLVAANAVAATKSDNSPCGPPSRYSLVALASEISRCD